MNVDTWDYYTIEGAIDMAVGAYWRAKAHQKSVEELEKELEDLKKRCDEKVELEQLDHFLYILQGEINGFKRDLEVATVQLEKLNGLTESYKREVDWQITSALVQGRIDAYNTQLGRLEKVYQEGIQKFKDGIFARDRVSIDEQIAEAKEDETLGTSDESATAMVMDTVLVAKISPTPSAPSTEVNLTDGELDIKDDLTTSAVTNKDKDK